MPQNIHIEPDKQNDTGPCECCGNMSRTIWGYLSVDGQARAVDYVQWTLNEVPKHGANVDLVMGHWGTARAPRSASHRIPGRHVLGNAVAADAYQFFHAILGQDPRVAELIQAAQK